MSLPWNHAGQLAGILIGLFWVALGWWWVQIGRRRSHAESSWRRDIGRIVDRDGGAEGLILRNPHVSYRDTSGHEQRFRARSRVDIWEPGQDVDIVVDPDDGTRAMLRNHAERATPYLVIGWFIIVVGILTLVASVMLAAWG